MNKLDFIHRFVPASAGSTARTLLLLHGTGGNENDMVPLGRDLDPTAALLTLRGNILENGMPRFFRRLAEGVFEDRKSTRLNSSHSQISYAVFCLKKKKQPPRILACLSTYTGP